MRVALLTNFVPPYRVPVFRALRDRVDELRIFVSTAMESNRTWKPDWADLDVRVQNTWTWRRTWKHERFTEGYDLHVPYDTVPRLMNWRPDVIISAEFGLRSAQAIAYANMARVPIIIWATLADHLERSRGAIRAFARRGMIHAIDRVIVNGESGARYIRSIGGNEDMIVRIPQAIDVQMFTSLPIARDPAAARRLLFCGAVSQLKGFDLVMEGLELWAHRFPQERISLAVVGTGPLLDTSKKRPRPAKVAIEWIGAVPYSSLPACYARAGILLFPTRGDEWGLVVNEAMA